MSAHHTRGAILALAATVLTLATACANPTAPAAAPTSARRGVTIGSSGDGVTIGSSGKKAATANGVTIGSSG